jgi:hypothetical protein
MREESRDDVTRQMIRASFLMTEKKPFKKALLEALKMEEQTTLVDEPIEYEVILDEEESGSENLPLDWEDQLYEQGRDKEIEKEEAPK